MNGIVVKIHIRQTKYSFYGICVSLCVCVCDKMEMEVTTIGSYLMNSAQSWTSLFYIICKTV